MTENKTDNFEAVLFAVDEKSYGEKYNQYLLEQYKLCVEMADRISSRRSKANTFFLSVNTLLVTAIGILTELGSSFASLNLWWVVVTSFAGILFCWTWLSTINSYRQLNSGKFKIINTIEQKLPLAIYKAEWAYLKPKNKTDRYKQLTIVELWVPKIFGVTYSVLMLIAIFLLFGWYG
jgi:hypothetical protein